MSPKNIWILDFCKAFLNLIYPKRCQICQLCLNYQDSLHLCQECFNKVKFNIPPFCQKCGKSILNTGHICSECYNKNFFFKNAYSACLYEGVIRECVHKFKYNGKLQLSETLSKIMVDFANRHLKMNLFDIIIPVPLHSAKQRDRQFNQAYILAKRFARYFNLPVSFGNLIKIKNTPAQIKLSKFERIKNLEEVFKIKKPALVYNKNILLIDDVFTTGTTVNECSRVLIDAGAKNIDVFTLARGS